MNIDNDIKSNPKLTVVGNVHITRDLYSDPSNTMQNITVSVTKAVSFINWQAIARLQAQYQAKSQEYLSSL